MKINPPKITALVLAAGQSHRMGGTHKLLTMVKGQAIIRHTVNNILQSRVDHISVVTGFENERLESCLQDLPVSFLLNPEYTSGMASSLAKGISALDASVDAALICLGDMPSVTPRAIDRLVQTFDPDAGCAICVPTHKGVQGNPVLWARHFFPELQSLTGDQGAKQLLETHEAFAAKLDMPDEPGIIFDIDTPTDLDAFGIALK